MSSAPVPVTLAESWSGIGWELARHAQALAVVLWGQDRIALLVAQASVSASLLLLGTCQAEKVTSQRLENKRYV